ncbi:MAG: CXXX repeat peptide maturase [Dysgonamonadaceae bacterium]|jgi:CXXX repeat peptide maturase|nr:CXXX repeat peptide maturase [Dysgonamonadaceae bacterium]
MLQYLIILLDDTSVSYCHYENTKTERRLISLDDLKTGIFFAMKQNLMIQFVYPDYELPEEYGQVIQSIDNHKIAPCSILSDETNVCVTCEWEKLPQEADTFSKEFVWVLRISKNNLFSNYEKLSLRIKAIKRLNLVITDVDTFREEDFSIYKKVLSHFQTVLKEQYSQDLYPQFNLLSDRILLDSMNNCNAGVENITLAPNGRFYICPAFYQENEMDSVGNLTIGPDITNRVLYRLDHAPLCRICDAYQCKRCVWLSRKTTLEVNTPSHEQCVVAHLERNAGRELLLELQQSENRFSGKSIEEIDYLDPFDIRKRERE